MRLQHTFLAALFMLGLILPAQSQTSNANKPCDAGPKILEIDDVTPDGAHVVFYGNNVFGLTARVIDQNGKVVSESAIKPESPDIDVRFKSLPPGSYTLKLSGSTCRGESTMAFVLAAGVARRAALQDAPEVRYITRGYAEHLGVVITGSPGNWVVNDTARVKPDPGYEFRYLINGHVLTSAKPLRNYSYQSNGPLRILKMKTRLGLQSLNQWSDKEKNGYFDPESGKVFSDNVTAGLCTVVFKVPAGDFVSVIPESYKPPLQTAVWADQAPDMKLPEGHFWVANRGEWPIQTLLSKGVTHISNYQLPWGKNNAEVQRIKSAGKAYNDVPRIEAFMNLKPSGPDKWENGYNLKYWPRGPLSEAEAVQKADATDNSFALWIGETMEGESYMSPDKPMWGHFYKRLRQRYERDFGAKKIPYLIAHNYFMMWPDAMKLLDAPETRAERLALFTKDPAQLPKTDYSPGGTLSSTNLIMEGAYLNAPDQANDALYNSMFRMELFKKMGYKSGVFLFGVHEWRPNNAYFYQYPDGRYFRKEKLPLDPNMLVAYAFVSQVYGNVYVEWGDSGKQTTRDWDVQWSGGTWYPGKSKQPSEQFPHIVKPNQTAYTGYTGSSDLSYFGISLYQKTFGQVEGGKRQYLRFRIDGGKWIEPDVIDGQNIVNAFYDKRGIALSQTKEGKTAWFYLNSFADNRAHKLDVVMPDGKVQAYTVAGNGVHVRLERR